jgi:hypothetical protein
MDAAEQSNLKINAQRDTGQQFKVAFLSFTVFQNCFTQQEKGGKEQMF